MGGRPVLEYLVDRMRAAAPDEIRVVTRPEKTDVIALCRRLDLAVHEARRPASPAESLACAIGDLGPDDVVLIGFPDTIWEPLEGFQILLEALPRAPEAALGLFPTDEPERSDVVVMRADWRVLRIAVKPASPPSHLLWGCAAARAGALAGLERYEEPGSLFDALARQGSVVGVRLSDSWIDVGTPEALSRAEAQLTLHGEAASSTSTLPVPRMGDRTSATP